jgi:chemotaxis protein CheX
MRSDVAQPFLLAAKGVLEQELGGDVGRGQVKVERGDFEAGEVTAVVGVTGALSGAVMYRMSEATALAIVGKMMGQKFGELDALARSGVGELGNVITGRAGVLLERAGVSADIAPPMLIVGRGGIMSSLDIPRLLVPLQTSAGGIDLQIALKQSS